jgi:nucleosome binding factor SPN SPT16 subunit
MERLEEERGICGGRIYPRRDGEDGGWSLLQVTIFTRMLFLLVVGVFDTYRYLQFWLLGYEFPATLFLITPEKFYVVTTAKKGNLLSLELARWVCFGTDQLE